MEPVNPSVNGFGTMSTKSVTVSGFKPMEKAADVLKLDRLRQQSIQDVNVSFKIIAGVINVDPFTVKMDGIPVKLYGYTTMDQNIEYNAEMEVPFEKFPQGMANQANSIVAQFNKKAGTNVSVGSKIPVKLKITGTVTDPQISTNYGEAGKEAIDNLKDQVVEQIKEEVKEQVNEAIDDGVEKAREAAAKLVADAQKQADAAKAEAKKLADKAKAEAYKLADDTEKSAKNVLEKTAKKIAADKIRKEADEKHAKAIAEANKKADKIVSDAKAKGDKMITDAEAQSKAKVNK
jgi:F0F1-type ATP synthase membrane subunit b/b'